MIKHYFKCCMCYSNWLGVGKLCRHYLGIIGMHKHSRIMLALIVSGTQVAIYNWPLRDDLQISSQMSQDICRLQADT